jgi:acetoin utilization deacetylase AcuC-like enzyme
MIGDGAGEGQPGKRATWTTYSKTLQKAIDAIQKYHPDVLIVSLGLDTHAQDPCASRRKGGFQLCGNDYYEMGRMVHDGLKGLPTLVVQEGGYKLDEVPKAVVSFLTGLTSS